MAKIFKAVCGWEEEKGENQASNLTEMGIQSKLMSVLSIFP